jgi:hypothetical protein
MPAPRILVKANVFKAAVPILCVAFVYSHCAAADRVSISVLNDERINESSGLAISYANPGSIWVHNDSGDEPRLFLVGLDGATQAVVEIAHVKAIDWEDVCSFQINGESWLLIGDIGDNRKRRGSQAGGPPACKLYLLKEPVIYGSDSVQTIPCDVWSMITFYYPDGPADCESLAVDVKQQEILLLTKSVPARLYRLDLDTKTPRQKVWADRVAEIRMPRSTTTNFMNHLVKGTGLKIDLHAPTAMDISPDGSTMVICTSVNGLAVTRTREQTWADAVSSTTSRTAFALPLPLLPPKQCEAICFDRSGASIYLNREGSRSPLWRVNTPK